MFDPWLIVQFATASIMGAVGAYFDLKTNEVSNWVWLIFGGLGGIFAVFQYGFSVLLGVHCLFALAISASILVAFYKFSRFIGGADAKAIIALSLIVSPFSFAILAMAVMFLVAYLSIKSIKERLDRNAVLQVQAPFLPFLLGGILVIFAALGFI